MTAEKWSAALEIVSFFLVTVDLFGKTRLIELQKRVNEASSKLRSMKIAKSYISWYDELFHKDKNLKKTEKFAMTAIFLGCLVLTVVVTKLLSEEFPYLMFLELLISFFVCILCLSLPLLVPLILLGLLEFFLDSFLSGIIFLITKFNLQGLMLVTGAILFLISKAIILYN